MSVRKLTLLSMLLAMSVLGANIKIFGSVALDSFPAFLGALILGPIPGALLGALGHFISALLAGFPLTLPVHILVTALMAVTMFIYGKIREVSTSFKKQTITISWIAAYFSSVLLDLLLLYPLIHETVFILFVPLTIATVINLFITEIVYKLIPNEIKN